MKNEPVYSTAVMTVIFLIVMIGMFAHNRSTHAAKNEDVKEQKTEARTKRELVPVSYTFVMKDGTTNIVDLTQVKEMNTNYDFVEKEVADAK